MMTHEDRNRPTDDVQEAKLLDDIDPDLAEVAEVHGGYQMQDSAWSLQRV